MVRTDLIENLLSVFKDTRQYRSLWTEQLVQQVSNCLFAYLRLCSYRPTTLSSFFSLHCDSPVCISTNVSGFQFAYIPTSSCLLSFHNSCKESYWFQFAFSWWLVALSTLNIFLHLDEWYREICSCILTICSFSCGGECLFRFLFQFVHGVAFCY